jgi:hypothetical protein
VAQVPENFAQQPHLIMGTKMPQRLISLCSAPKAEIPVKFCKKSQNVSFET